MLEDKFARVLKEARSECAAVSLMEALSKQDLAFGYQVQKAIIALNQQEGNELTGWKVAFSSQAALDRFSLEEPIYAPLFEANKVTGELTQNQAIAPKIESEIMFVLGKSLIGSDVSDEDILAAIKWMAPAIEVADCRIQGWKFDINHFVADNAAAGFYQFGEMLPFDSKVLDESSFSCRLDIGDTSELGSLTNVLNGPLGSVVRMIRGVLLIFGEVKAGQQFLSGSLTKPIDMALGHTYRLHLLGQTVELRYI